ncbi:MAG: DUF3793 family protein [Lachnospiraceae bacterium]|nr:DUF3793 family protein [Lachnospiraceae bacterium]
MPDRYVVEHSSPTLAGIKTGSLFQLLMDGGSVEDEFRELNRTLVGKGLRAVPVQRPGSPILVYLYRPCRLCRDLDRPVSRRILERKGYDCRNADRCVAQLVRHFTEDSTFPHEVGLFLGYPPEDVEKFMENPRCGVKCVGCWKAYGNEDKARRIFLKYRKCTETYRKRVEGGKTLKQLIVEEHRESQRSFP